MSNDIQRNDSLALTKDLAMAEARRALVKAYGPERGEAILEKLIGSEATAAQKAMKEVASAVASNPAGAFGALAGGIIGAALAKASGRR